MVDTLDANFEDCRDTAHTGFGDHRIAECINKTTDNQLTQLDGLYQIDLHGKSSAFNPICSPACSSIGMVKKVPTSNNPSPGDRSGVFESGRPIIS